MGLGRLRLEALIVLPVAQEHSVHLLLHGLKHHLVLSS